MITLSLRAMVQVLPDLLSSAGQSSNASRKLEVLMMTPVEVGSGGDYSEGDAVTRPRGFLPGHPYITRVFRESPPTLPLTLFTQLHKTLVEEKSYIPARVISSYVLTRFGKDR